MSDQLSRRGLMGLLAQAAAIAPLASASGSALAASAVGTPGEGRKIAFDDGWSFSLGDRPGAQDPAFAVGDWTPVHLPHDWSLPLPLDEAAPSGGSGGYAVTGIGWYRKTITLPRGWRGKRVAIQFDGVYQRSEVWINGHSLGLRPYGYISFVYDLTPYLRTDGQPDVIAVRVDNSLQPNSRWYSGSGIYRHVWLVVTDPVHIAPWGVHVWAPSPTAAAASVEARTRAVNTMGAAQTALLRAAVIDRDGQTVAMSDVHADIPAGGDFVFEHRLKLANPALWSLETPHLYRLRTTLMTGGRVLDTQDTPFGIRDAVFDVDKGFVLNGERIKLNGVCLHGDGGAVGAAVPERIWERRLGLLKDMGCNAIRCAHNPPAPEFLDLCDRMGFAVMAEPFDEWREAKVQTPQYGYHHYFDDWWQRDVAAMLERDRNHPSIVIWSVGNEIPDQKVALGPQTLQKLLDVFHDMDPTRPVTAACDNIAAEPTAALPEFLDKLDVVGYNYVDRWRDRREKYYALDRHDHPKWRFVGTESTGLGGIRGDYAEKPVFMLAEQPSNRRIEVEQLQKFIQTWDYVSGDFIWTGIDYLGESRWPGHLGSAGCLDTCGFAKDSFYFYQSIWSKTKTVLHVSPHWNWAGREGEIIPVICYTNCDTVELFLNGKSLGVKGFAFPRPGMIKAWPTYPPRADALQTTADLHLAWDVAYAPGILKAVGIKDGQVVDTVEIATTSAPAALRLSVDRAAIAATWSDVAHVTVEIVDVEGRTVPTADTDLTFALTGPGRIIGLDNGRPDSHESYRGDRRQAFNGLALALVQSPQRAGEMTLGVSAAGLTGASLRITAA